MLSFKPNGAVSDAPDDLRTVVEELELFDVLVVTDADKRLKAHLERGDMPGAHVVSGDVPFSDRLALPAARAGKKVRIWCTPTERGRRVAREAAATLKPCLPDNGGVRFITGVDPKDWLTAVDPFGDLVDSARKTMPPANRTAGAAAGRNTTPDRDRWNTTPRAVARTLLRQHAGRILGVDVDPAEKPENQHPTAYAVDEKTGLWDTSTKTWTRWCFGLARILREELRESGLEGRAYAVAESSIRRIERPGAVKELRRSVWAAADELREEGEAPDQWGLTRCRPEQLDAEMRYLGAANGVVDLHTGRLLDPKEGRKALVTLWTFVKYDPDAWHPDVDRLFGHVALQEREWWWSVLGYHLRGNPSGRVYLVKGPPDGGKSTVAQALRLALGPYASTPAFGAIEERSRHSETELSPGIHAFTAPRRFALIDEVKTKRINNRLVKDLSGDGRVTYRLLNQNLQTREATATMLMFCNAGSVPRLHLEDEGMQKRYRELSYPAIPRAQIDPTFITERIRTDDFQRALLTRLVAEAAKADHPPANVPAVALATAERVHEDIGELGEFARRIRPGGSGVLTGYAVWEAWCEHVGEKVSEGEAGGINRRGITKALCSRINGLPTPRLYSVSGNKVRGWRDWKLLPPPPVQIELGEIRSGEATVEVTLTRVKFHPERFVEIAEDESQPRERREKATRWAQFLEDGTGVITRKAAEDFLDGVGDPPDELRARTKATEVPQENLFSPEEEAELRPK